MPFMNGARDGALMGQALRESYENARRNAYDVVNVFNDSKGIQSNDLTFAADLLRYLEKRINESFTFSFNTEQIIERANFTREMFVALKNNDLDAQIKLLDEKKIIDFKGFFTSRMYDILVERRGAINERLSTKMESGKTLQQSTFEPNVVQSFEKRKNESAKFVSDMLAALKKNDLVAQLKLLDDKEISKFKGFFSRRLYDLCIERRGAIQERLLANKIEIANTAQQVTLR